MTYRASYLSPLGAITLASDGKALTGLWFDGQKYFGSTLPVETKQGDCPVFAQAKRWLDSYFAGEKPDFTPPLHWMTTPFRRAVWEILLTVPYGCTTTYGQIAAQLADRMGKPQSAQAVGGAVGHNPISILIPCHRVVGADGSLTGYAGGVEKKRFLLALEGVDMTNLYMPKRGTAL